MKSLVITPLGGLGEVGMNNLLLNFSGVKVLLDCGTASSHSPWLGYDSVFPDYSEFFKTEDEWPRYVLITHGHEDHIGALPFFLKQSPVIPTLICTNFTSKLIRLKLEEHGCLSRCKIQVYSPGELVTDIPGVQVEYFPNNHSIIDSNALRIVYDGKTIVHTGDFRIDSAGFREASFQPKDLLKGEKRVELLLSDSTNSEREGWSISEQVVAKSLSKIFAEAKGRVVLSCFASNVRRLQSTIEAAIASERKICSLGRSMDKFIHLGQEEGVLNLPERYRMELSQVDSVPKEEQCILLTGSQGEFQASLSRIAYGNFREIDLEEGDTFVFSALQIPGNELRIRAILNRLSAKGVKVYQNKPQEIVHSTGHAYKEELKEVLEALNPHYFLPVHGDRCMLEAHANLARDLLDDTQIFVIENGQSLSWQDKIVQHSMGDDAPIKKSWARFYEMGSLEVDAIKDRKKIAREGMIHCSVFSKLLSEGLSEALAVDFIGMISFSGKEEEEISYIKERMSKDFYEKFAQQKGNLEEWVRSWIRSYFRKVYNIRPVIRVRMISG